MKSKILLTLLLILTVKISYPQMKPLTKDEERVILHKGTEAPFTGKYLNNKQKGTYLCRRCGNPLYRSSDKFDSGCGWPSFDDQIPGAVTHLRDHDGIRTEIVCSKCNGHLGHIFEGERFTKKDVRHCVNSMSLQFVSEERVSAIFAGGCFWGVEHMMQRVKGVIEVISGYTGGDTKNPGYREVCEEDTGHAEAVEVVYDSNLVSYETLVKYFFEIHDPTQVNRQGPDIGFQYRSAIFFKTDDEKKVAEKIISELEKKGFKVATELQKAQEFWPAEDYHQDYYARKGGVPYCHSYKKRF